MKSAHVIARAAGLVLAAGVSVGYAAEDELETVIVTAEREPGNLYVDGAQLQDRQATTIEDLFSHESSVAVGGGSTVAQKIYVRGFEDVMLNVTVDGAQSPGELYHHQGRVQLEPEFIKSIELDAGAGAATNGAGALTGALRTTLKDAFDLLGADRRFGAMLKAGGEFNGDDGYHYSASAYGRLTDNVGVVATWVGRDRDDYDDGRGNLRSPSTYEQQHGYLKFNGEFGAHRSSLTYERLDDEAITYERPNLVNFTGTYQLSDQQMSRDTLVLNYGFRPEGDAIDLQATAYSNTTDFLVQRLSSTIIHGDGKFESQGLDVRNTSQLGDHAVTFGVDYRGDDVKSAQNATPPFAWGTTRQSASVMGLYAQDNWQVADALRLSFGARFDDYEFKGKAGVSNDVKITDSGFSPNVGITWEPTDGLELRTSYARAFRGVTIREAFFSALYAHDGTLQSEKADNLEFGASWERNGFFTRGTLYRQNIDNYIDAVFSGPTPVWGYWRNTGDAKVKGYEVEAGYRFEGLRVSAGVWEADNSLDGAPLDDANLGLGTTIGRTWLGRVEGALPQWGIRYGTAVRFVEKVDNAIATTAPPKRAYFVADAWMNWAPTDQLNVALSVKNLLDRFYYDHATYTWVASANTYAGYPSVGREISASVSFRF